MSSPDIRGARRALRLRTRRGACAAQRGATLIELLVGIAIGLLVIVAALGALVLSSGTATLVNDISQLQQQGSYALRVLGTQFRQAGSLEPADDLGVGLFAFKAGASAVAGTPDAVFGTEGAAAGPDSVSVASTPLP